MVVDVCVAVVMVVVDRRTADGELKEEEREGS